MSDNENIERFDDLIRSDSEQEVYTFQEADWEQLQMMMNEKGRRKKIGWFWRGTGAVILIVAVILLFSNDSPIDAWKKVNFNVAEFQLMDKKRTDKTAKSTEIKTTDRISREKSEKGNTDLPDTAQESSNKGNTQTVNQLAERAFSHQYTEKPIKGKQNSIEESDQNAGNINNELSVLITKNDQKPNDSAVLEDDLLLTEEPTLNPENLKEDEIDKQDVAENSDSETADPVVDTPETEGSPENDDTNLLTTGSSDSSSSRENKANRKMHLYVGIGTEWSAASNMRPGPIKLKFQIGGEYQFLKNWSVLSGVNYVVKDYQTDADGYAVEQGFWTGGIKPNTISAVCNVLEIPLNVRYYFNAQDSVRSSFYLTAGASSYLMASERYNFTYDVQDPALKQGWNGKWENIHYFSVLHLSAGYQKSINRNCSILFEPYVDLPLGGIGFGQVDLISFGLSLNYKF